MAEVTISSDKASFEENLFFISQAQRLLVQIILNGNYPVWLDSYAEDLHLDSFNEEFKCFYLHIGEGYLGVDSTHERIFRALFETGISTVDAMDYEQLIGFLIEFNELDWSYNTASRERLVSAFWPSNCFTNDEAYQQRVLSRVKGIFASLLKIL